tara:strand:- start:1295 stop:1462 length:168 start_codon:yes stop_codon:yes gene_type:complete
MKKNFSRCNNCGEDNSILTQFSSGPEITLLCSECYKSKYLKEVKNKNNYVEEEKN